MAEHAPSSTSAKSCGASSRTLLEPGHEEEWARLNAQKREALTPPSGTPVEDLLRQGQALSKQAAWLLDAVERGRESGG